MFSLCPLEVNLHTYLTTWLSLCPVGIFFGFFTILWLKSKTKNKVQTIKCAILKSTHIKMYNIIKEMRKVGKDLSWFTLWLRWLGGLFLFLFLDKWIESTIVQLIRGVVVSTGTKDKKNIAISIKVKWGYFDI